MRCRSRVLEAGVNVIERPFNGASLLAKVRVIVYAARLRISTLTPCRRCTRASGIVGSDVTGRDPNAAQHGRDLGRLVLGEAGRAAPRRRPTFSALYMQICTYSTAADRARILGCNEAEVSNDAVWDRHRAIFDALPAGVSFLRKEVALDLAVYLPGLGLAYNDRASMEHGVEVRVPWLDLELVRCSLGLPDSVLIRR